jgi:hypothetical protein
MTPEDARALAEAELEHAKSLNASHEHPESLKRAKLAGVILDLCAQLDAATNKTDVDAIKHLAEHYKPAKAKK